MTSEGYGRVEIQGKRVQAHRVAYELVHGPIEAGKLGLHRCDVRLCCNPSHIYGGTNIDNMRDMRERGRSCHGVKNASAKLSAEAVRRIRKVYAAGGVSRMKLAKRYGVCVNAVSNILTGRSWSREAGPRQKVSSGRGSEAPQAKLTEDQVRQIRAEHRAGATAKALGKKFGVSDVLVGRICRREYWTHI